MSEDTKTMKFIEKMGEGEAADYVKSQLAILKEQVDLQHSKLESLTEGTPYGSIEAVPDHDIFEDLPSECKDSEFWANLKEVAPILFCFASEVDPKVSSMRDQCVTAEILKTKSILS